MVFNILYFFERNISNQMKYPHLQQHDEKDCGAACLSMISEYYGMKLPLAQFRELIKVDSKGANIYGIVTGATKIGLNAEALEGNPDELIEGIKNNEFGFPFIARIVNEYMFEHFIVVYGFSKGSVITGDPGKTKITRMSFNDFFNQWQGHIVTFGLNSTFKKKNERKGSFTKFFKYITSQKKLLAFVFVISLIVSFINLFGSVIFQYVIDSAIEKGDTTGQYVVEECSDENCTEEHDEFHNHVSSKAEQFLVKAENKLRIIFANINTVCISIISLYFLRFCLNLLRGYLLALTSKKVEIPLTLNYYNHLIDLPAEFFETRKTGELMSRFQNASEIRQAVSTATLTIMLDTLMAIVCGIFLFIISHTLFYITLIIMVIYALIMIAFRKPIKTVNYTVMEKDAVVTSYLKETVEGIETIKTNQSEQFSKFKTKNLFTEYVDNIVKGMVTYTFQNSAISFVSSSGMVILLWVGSYLCVKDIISIGTLITFYYMIGYFLDPVKNLINLQPELQTAIVAADRLNDVIEATPEEKSHSRLKSLTDLNSDIVFENVDFKYGNRDLVLKKINIKIPKGSKIAIVGESGCGKTTLAKLILGFYSPENGNIKIGINDINDISISSLRNHIAYIPENIFMFSDTIENNLKMGNENITHDDIEKVCKECYINDFISDMPMGYHTMIDENGSNISGGQKQRLAIARALLRNPDVLIMDEATSNLDSITENNIQETINKLSENMTCVIIAHKLKTIKNCDYIYVMDKGRIAEEGTHEDLMIKNGIYAKYWLV